MRIWIKEALIDSAHFTSSSLSFFFLLDLTLLSPGLWCTDFLILFFILLSIKGSWGSVFSLSRFSLFWDDVLVFDILHW